jgi:hypothetical protein
LTKYFHGFYRGYGLRQLNCDEKCFSDAEMLFPAAGQEHVLVSARLILLSELFKELKL